MQCPRDGSPLTRQGVHGVGVESCPVCRGMFLDRGELNRVAEPIEGDLEYSTLEDESFEHDDAYPTIACPRCCGASEKVEFNIHTGIVLDHCGHCGGFWLDSPELDRINDEVRRLNEQAVDTEAPAMLWFAAFIWSLPR